MAYERTVEIREKNRQAQLAYLANHPNPFLGMKMSEEAKRKLSVAHKGKILSKEHCQNISNALVGNQYRKGKPHDFATRKKISLTIKAQRGTSRYSFEWREWKRAVYARDGLTCVLCRKSGQRSVCAHHVYPTDKYPERAFDVDNGIVLCRTCHSGLHLMRAFLGNGVNSGKDLLVRRLITAGLYEVNPELSLAGLWLPEKCNDQVLTPKNNAPTSAPPERDEMV